MADFNFPLSLQQQLNPGSTILPVNNNHLIYTKEMQREIDLIFNDTYVQRGKQFLRPEPVETTPPSPEQLRPLLAHKYCYPGGHCSLSEFVDTIVTETVSSSDTRQQLYATENVATPHFLVNRPTSTVSPIPTNPWMYRGLLEETKLPPPPSTSIHQHK